MSQQYNIFLIHTNPMAPKFTVPASHGKCTVKGVSFGGWTVLDEDGLTGQVSEYEPTRTTVSKSPPDPSSWEAKKRSGRVVMSPYHHNKTVVQDYIAGRELLKWRNQWEVCSTATVCHWSYDSGNIWASYREQGHFDSWVRRYPNIPIVISSDLSQEDIKRAVDASRSEAVSNALKGYDVLTELAELPEAIKFVRSSTGSLAGILTAVFAGVPESTRRRALRMTPKALLRSTDKALQAIGRKWMAYRYAVMPLVYSYKDISSLLNEKDTLFRTFRSKRDVSPRALGPSPNQAGFRIEKNTSGNCTVRTTVKMGYTAASISSASRVSFNPFVTAWELTTLSFVVDWFLNVGDFIVAHTAVDLSSTSGYCTSVKIDVVETYELVDQRSVTIPARAAQSPCLGSRPEETRTLDSREILRVATTQSYNRSLFTRSDVNLGLQTSFLNWKRSVDSLVLGYHQAKSLVRKLIK